ncbi:GTPase Obg [Posidoniimonas polymericola]|uniref:GTPase Obg n=1 Tax=Posidoniimonas polymericola TaxID=2528002 RepID=A0A5C5YFX3_9BACT|nr:GTPase ObgE [Posidoniimonas polymericola]TWT73839.1 GTPase Obg [Posidoniimonas polymericola]
MFVDRVQIEVQAGRGGDGCMSFRREKYIPRGGPDGGDGGNGGSIIIRAEDGIDSLSALVHKKHWKARSGVHGSGSNRHGANADDLEILVPPGTVVRDDKHDLLLKDLAEPGDSVVAAHGGKGGKGNSRFKSSTNQAPREFTRGEEGEQRLLVFELKVIADIGLLGKPNAGKSTLLSRVSRARPEIADYPFTTKKPNLGIVQVDMDRSFVMADIPGLIEGAASGAGLGHEFLRHVERTRVLIHLVEPSPMDGTDPIENYRAIRQEVEQHASDLAARPEIIAVSKAELPDAPAVRDLLAEETGKEAILFSSVTGQNLDKLLARAFAVLAEERE